MMVGSILSNCWGGLIAFAITFFVMLSRFYHPNEILITSSVISIITFFSMFLVRYLIGYILHTPESEGTDEEEQERVATSTVEFQDESSEDIAEVVRTMLNSDDNDT